MLDLPKVGGIAEAWGPPARLPPSWGRRFLGIELCETTAEKARQRLVGSVEAAAQ
jgi:hypothetical protein